jgi:uncharacterized protein (TIGR03905 family)
MKTYKTQGVCAREIQYEVENGKVRNVKIIGGCAGNRQGIAKLVEGMDAEEVIKRLEGIDCRGKGTSCPDQLAKALKQELE